MGTVRRQGVVITAITALTAQEVKFGAEVAWVQIKNNSPINIYVRGDGGAPIDVVWPGDIEDYGEEVGNKMDIYGDAASVAADILLGHIVYFKYEFKRREA